LPRPLLGTGRGKPHATESCTLEILIEFIFQI
jgi:hypothetical protein